MKTKITKLYDLPKGAKIYNLQPDHDKDGIVIFDHLDGMYSYCWVEGHKDKLVHLNAATPLKSFKDGWELAYHSKEFA